jgi:hypothetical protein
MKRACEIEARRFSELPYSLYKWTLLTMVPALALAFHDALRAQPPAVHRCFEVRTHRMDVDVDGAPNAYGPPGKPTLDLVNDRGKPILQGPEDPFPGYYISQTAFADVANPNERDPRSYVDARKINYVVRGDEARRRGVKVGDFVAVYSERSEKAVFAIVGDTGNPTGDEGSLHLLQDLGYPFHDGNSGSVTRAEIIVRFFPESNPKHSFFFIQSALDEAATKLGLSRDFSDFDRGKPVRARAGCQ